MDINDSPIVAELAAAVDTKRKSRESAPNYLKRLVAAVTHEDFSDEQWDALSEDAQAYVSAAAEAINAGNDVPMPEGVEDAAGESDQSGEGSEGGEPAPKAGRKKKSRAKKDGGERAERNGKIRLFTHATLKNPELTVNQLLELPEIAESGIKRPSALTTYYGVHNTLRALKEYDIDLSAVTA